MTDAASELQTDGARTWSWKQCFCWDQIAQVWFYNNTNPRGTACIRRKKSARRRTAAVARCAAGGTRAKHRRSSDSVWRWAKWQCPPATRTLGCRPSRSNHFSGTNDDPKQSPSPPPAASDPASINQIYRVAQKVSHCQESSLNHAKTANEARFCISFEYKMNKRI